MHKEVKNDKVLRAITIGIAAMMATSAMPLTVFADENPEASGETPAAESQRESSSVKPEENTSTQPVETITQNVAQAETHATEAESSISGAIEQTSSIDDATITDNLAGAQMLFDGVSDQPGVIGELDAAKSIMTTATEMEATANTLAGTADKTANALNNDLSDYSEADAETTTHASDTIAAADKANTSKKKKEAYEAKAEAVKNLGLVEEGFKEANDAFNAALIKAEQAETEYSAAEEAHKAALEKVEEAKARLAEAETNAIAASEMLKAAQQRADSLGRRAEKLQENSEKLEEVREQYYAMMVQYYRDVLGKETVYHDDGTLDVKACAEKITADQINAKAKSPGNKVMELGRDLLNKLVEMNVIANDDIDWDTYKFGVDGKTAQKAREGIVFESSEIVSGDNGADQVVTEKPRYNKDGLELTPNSTYTFKWDRSTQDDMGRTNRVRVTYTGKDGVEHEEYYNYLFKSESLGENDLDKGVVYLTRVVKNKEGAWETQEISDPDALRDYSDILEAIEASKTIEDYKAAQLAVAEAVSKVDALTKEIESLQSVGADSSVITELREKLDQANQDLADATEKKVELQDKVEEARRAVDNIDLSRFKDREEKRDPEEPSPSPSSPSDVIIPPAPVMPAIDASIQPAVSETRSSIALSDVAGARAKAPEESRDIREFIGNLELPDGNGKETATLNDDVLPGAATTPESEREQMNWWWLLVIALFGAAGVSMYEKHKAKKRQSADD